MNDIMTGKKRYVKNDQLKKAYCPQIEGKTSSNLISISDALGLYMADLVGFIAERRGLHEYFPDVEEIPKQGKQWVKNMLRILCEDEFRAWVNQRCQQHREKVDRVQNNNVRRLIHM